MTIDLPGALHSKTHCMDENRREITKCVGEMKRKKKKRKRKNSRRGRVWGGAIHTFSYITKISNCPS